MPLAALFFFDATTALANSGRNTRATTRLMERIDNAKANYLAKEPPDAAGYLRVVQSFDASRAPAEVRLAFSNYMAALPGTNSAPAEALLRQAAARYIRR